MYSSPTQVQTSTHVWAADILNMVWACRHTDVSTHARPRPRPAPTPIFFFFFFGGGRDDDDDGGCDDDDACAGSTHVSMRQARSKHISVKREDAHLVPVEESPLRIADGREEEAPARRRGLTHLGLEPRLSHIQRAHLMGAESRSLHARKSGRGRSRVSAPGRLGRSPPARGTGARHRLALAAASAPRSDAADIALLCRSWQRDCKEDCKKCPREMFLFWVNWAWCRTLALSHRYHKCVVTRV